MPWTHCEVQILDDEPCPECGITKEVWTVNFELTRTFQVTRRPLIKVNLVNRLNEPVPAERFTVALPNEATVEAELDQDGYHKVVSPEPGTCLLTFPYWAEGEVERLPDDPEAEASEEEGSEPPASSTTANAEGVTQPEEEPARFECRTRTKAYRFKVVVPYLDVELRDQAGAPVPDRDYELKTDGGDAIHAGTLDDRGWSRVKGIDEGEYELAFPALDQAAWSLAEPAPDEAAAD